MKVLLCFLLGVAAGCSPKPAPYPAPPAPAVEGDSVTFATNAPQLASLTVEAAQPRQFAVTHLTGRLYWNDDATVRIFTPVAGRVLSTKVDIGDPVSIGAPLALIDSPDFAQARADALTSDGNLGSAQKAYERSKLLLAHGAAAQKDVDFAQAAFIAAQAEHDRAEARLANYGGSDHSTNTAYVLRSPLAGVLVDKNINPGQEVRPDQMLANMPALTAPLFVVSDPTHLWLQIDVPESDLSLLEPKERLRIYTPAFPDKMFDGTVSRIGDTFDPSTRTVKVRGEVDNPQNLLKAEMYVTVDVVENPGQTQKAVEISAKATFMKGNNYYLFVEESPGHFVRRQVTLGLEKDGKVPVFAGVSPGQRVVTEGCLLLEALVDPTS
ncbi:MAG TPA: efflux RND transporter periplasmic adaptor subunit [Candidatus Saccharimonadales bacterium]|nr:efflux RND transporter periplasmic adaptor subunit [Candidatus Saccharimonadales bacterium]